MTASRSTDWATRFPRLTTGLMLGITLVLVVLAVVPYIWPCSIPGPAKMSAVHQARLLRCRCRHEPIA